jgi:hypothetical protein
MGRRGCSLPANASGFDPHRASISSRFGQVSVAALRSSINAAGASLSVTSLSVPSPTTFQTRIELVVTVSRPFPSWNRSMLTEIDPCHACSRPEILRTETAGQVFAGAAGADVDAVAAAAAAVMRDGAVMLEVAGAARVAGTPAIGSVQPSVPPTGPTPRWRAVVVRRAFPS